MTKLSFTIIEEFQNYRLDKFLSYNFPDKTRSYIQKLIKDGNVLLNKLVVQKPGLTLKLKDKIEITIPKAKPLKLQAKNIPLDIVFENKDMLIINKQAGIVVHPSITGEHSDDSIVNAVLHHCKNDLSGINGTMRPGIVHRLDKDTSGLLMIAKNDTTHQYLSKLIQERNIKKEYLALVKGRFEHKKGRIEAPIGRSHKDRKKMAVGGGKGDKMAISEFEVVKEFKDTTLVRVNLITGRTHQIRVHFASISHPVCGDTTYGDKKMNTKLRKIGLKRQFLHAEKLTFKLPGKDSNETFVAKIDEILSKVLEKIE